MKILYITNVPSPYKVDFFNELGKICNLTVLFERNSAANRNPNWKNKEDNMHFTQININATQIGKESSISIKPINIIKKDKFDSIILNGYSSPTSMIVILYLSLKKIPFIMMCDGGLISIENKIKFNIKKFFISKASLWLSTGSVTSKYLKHYGAINENIRHYPFTSVKNNEILIVPTNKSYYKQKLNVAEEYMVLAVGQFIYRKGFDILIRACQNLNGNIGVYIIGGVPTDEYVKMLKKLNLDQVHFRGFLNNENLNDYYLASDIFVHPTREDIWGLVINEAMAKGLPIVTTNKCVAGLELIEDGINGFIIPVENSEVLAKTINRIVVDKHLMSFMGENNVEKIKQYTIEKMAKKVYQQIKDI